MCYSLRSGLLGLHTTSLFYTKLKVLSFLPLFSVLIAVKCVHPQLMTANKHASNHGQVHGCIHLKRHALITVYAINFCPKTWNLAQDPPLLMSDGCERTVGID
jgi:hypothetical protein